MSAFNILICNIECPICKQSYEGRIQFKYGDTWQFEYRVGDKIKWGGNDIGKPNQCRVMIYGILESDICPICHNFNTTEEYDIYIEEDIIKYVKIMEDINIYSSGDDDYVILDK